MSRYAKIPAKFELVVANSRDSKDYQRGQVPFVTSAETNNGVVNYVSPLEDDKVFTGPCVVISGLGFASLQTGRFLPKGNGGDSCTVVFGKEPMSPSQYLSFAAVFNVLHRWRFSYGRKCKLSRLSTLEVPWPLPALADTWTGELGLFNGVVDEFGSVLDAKVASDLETQVEVILDPVSDSAE